MVAFNKFNSFGESCAHKKHNLSTDQLRVALCAAANAPVAGNSVLTDLTQITYTFLSTRNITTTSSGQTAGTYKLVLQDLALSASGGNVGPFRYVVIYNDTATNDELIGWSDYGVDVTLVNGGDPFTLNFSEANGVLQLV